MQVEDERTYRFELKMQSVAIRITTRVKEKVKLKLKKFKHIEYACLMEA